MLDILENQLRRSKDIMRQLQSHIKAQNTNGQTVYGVDIDPETYPWRVVCYPRGSGDGQSEAWAVVDSAGHEHRRYTGERACYLAHARARAMKCLHPEGYIELGPEGLCNVSGPAETVIERLAGRIILFRSAINVHERLQGEWWICPKYCQAPAGKTITMRKSRMQRKDGRKMKWRQTALPVRTLQTCKNFEIDLPLKQFMK